MSLASGDRSTKYQSDVLEVEGSPCQRSCSVSNLRFPCGYLGGYYSRRHISMRPPLLNLGATVRV
jgi:hypothetical protein